jgi:hypothetical protein
MNERSVDSYSKAAKAHKSNEEEWGWSNAGDGSRYSAESLGKAIEAEEAGKFGAARQLRAEAEQQIEEARKALAALRRK